MRSSESRGETTERRTLLPSALHGGGDTRCGWFGAPARCRAPLPIAFLLALVLCGCAGPSAQPELDLDSTEPFVLVLGTAQDGGLPQLGCQGPHCRAARLEPTRRRLVSSLLLVDPRSGQRWLFDATPDLAEQVERAERAAPRAPAEGRPPLFDGVFLTHAHIGHYLGLAELGREAYGSRAQVVHATPRMSGFLEANGPWDRLVSEGHLRIDELNPGAPVQLAPDLTVEAFTVPHRDEYSDTVGFRIRGPRRSLLFVPDIDKWERYADMPFESLLGGVDVALVDGTFFADGEIPGRAMADIPHPFIVETLTRFSAISASARGELWFTHLNHTNPAADPTSTQAAAVLRAGAHVASDGQRFPL